LHGGNLYDPGRVDLDMRPGHERGDRAVLLEGVRERSASVPAAAGCRPLGRPRLAVAPVRDRAARSSVRDAAAGLRAWDVELPVIAVTIHAFDSLRVAALQAKTAIDAFAVVMFRLMTPSQRRRYWKRIEREARYARAVRRDPELPVNHG
jgi:hypothetical protein